MIDTPEKIEARKNQEDPIVMYLIVRESLGMSIGKIAAQCGHAVGMIMLHYLDLCRKEDRDGDLWGEDQLLREAMDAWLKSSFRKVVLRADDKEWVKFKTMIDADEYDWESVTVVDSGLTEIAPGSETVIGLWPMKRSEAPKLVKRLQVLK